MKPNGAPICTLFTSLILICYMYSADTFRYYQYTRILMTLLLLVSVGIFYDGTNVVNRYRYQLYGDTILYDESLVTLDTHILGWLFPHGQLALYLDTNEYIGVNSSIGIYYAELLQLFYVSYYVWGNAVCVWLYYIYLFRSTDNKSKIKNYRRINMFLTTWTGTFMLNFICNLLYPAVSPRLYLRHEYTNEIHGLFMCDLLRGALTIAAKGTYSAFPSGHCGQSWIAALIGYRCRNIIHKYCVYILILAAALISLATVVMRYHYFVDFIGSLALVCIGAYFGGFQSDHTYEALLNMNSSDVNNNHTTNDYIDTDDKHKLSNQYREGIELVVVQ